MRMSSDETRDEQRAFETIASAIDAGMRVFDTAHAYGPGESGLGHNERLLAGALRACGAGSRARIVTKGGMSRAGGGWIPDGRAKTLLRDCEASVEALGGLPIDLYLIHAPDPRTPWRTSVRALARLVEEGLVGRIGVANINRRQLDEALELAPIAAVQVALNPFGDRALRGGIVERCTERGLALMAHSPLGGPGRAGGLERRQPLTDLAAARGVSPAEVAIAWLLALSPVVVAIPGARRPETARSAARAAKLSLDRAEKALLDKAFGGERPARAAPRASGAAASVRDEAEAVGDGAEEVLVMGIPGAGKSAVAEEYVARGYMRLNRDQRGGSLRGLAEVLDTELAAGVRRVVLDNTFLSRAARSYAVDAARSRAIPARCVWVDTPLAQAQVNLVERLLDRFNKLPSPDELRVAARREAGLLAPTSQMRALRELEPPSTDEGLTDVERVPFVRAPWAGRTAACVFVAAQVLGRPGREDAIASGKGDAPHLIFDWRPGETSKSLAGSVSAVGNLVAGPVRGAVCPHPGGPPICWCRPPLPGLALAFAREHGADPSRSIVIGAAAAHRTLGVPPARLVAATLGAAYVSV